MRRALLACVIPAAPAPPPFDRAAVERDASHEFDDLHDAAARSDHARWLFRMSYDRGRAAASAAELLTRIEDRLARGPEAAHAR